MANIYGSTEIELSAYDVYLGPRGLVFMRCGPTHFCAEPNKWRGFIRDLSARLDAIEAQALRESIQESAAHAVAAGEAVAEAVAAPTGPHDARD